MKSALVLASASPRRAKLLRQMGLSFDVLPADIDEIKAEEETIADYVVRLARQKAEAIATQRVVLAADTVVMLEGQLLEKPQDRMEAIQMLSALSNTSHQVLTGLAVRKGDRHVERLVTTEVWFREISGHEIEQYVASGESDDKSGAYGIQGLGGIFVQRINGCAPNVAGLPLAATEELLNLMGVDTWHVREQQNLVDCS